MGFAKDVFLAGFIFLVLAVTVSAALLPEISVRGVYHGNDSGSSAKIILFVENKASEDFYDGELEVFFENASIAPVYINFLKSRDSRRINVEDNLSHAINGTYPIIVKSSFYNKDAAHLSGIDYGFVFSGDNTRDLSSEISGEMSYSDNGGRLLLRNSGDNDKRVFVRFFSPDGINVSFDAEKFSGGIMINGYSNAEIPFGVKAYDFSQESYDVLAIVEHENEGIHFTKVFTTKVFIEKPKSLIPAYFSGILILVGIIAVFLFRKKLADKRELLVSVCVLVLIVLFLFSYFEPKYLLKTTTISGGDTSSHNFMAKEMKEKFLPSGKVFGWSNGWWNGFPMFQFYFFIPYLLMALLSFAMPLQIAFRIVSVLGIFSLPVSVYFSLRMMRFKFPMPILGAIASLFLLFGYTHTMWGVNIYSTLAGEISQSISFSLMVLFFGLLYRGIEENKHRVLLAILLSFVVLTHLTTTIIAVFAGGFFLIETDWRKFLRRVKFLAFVFGTAFLLTSFWTMPLVFKSKFATGFGENWDVNLIESFPPETLFFVVMALAGFFFCVKNKDKRFFYVGIPLFAGLLLWKFAFFINLVDIRFWPFLHYGLLVLGAYGFSEIAILLSSRKRLWFIAFASAILFMIFAMLWIEYNPRNVVHEWVKWNYEGYEEKSHWKDLKEMMDFFDGKDYRDGRVASTMNSRHNIFGSPRVFELIPYFTKMPYIEGAIEQSSVSSPFGRFVQCKTSRECAGFPRDVKVQEYNIEDAKKYFRMYNVRYFISESEDTFNELMNSSEWKAVKSVGGYTIYESRQESHYISVPEFEPIVVEQENWKKISLEWFYSVRNLDVPLIFVDSDSAGKKVYSYKEILDVIKKGNLRKISSRIDNNCKISEEILDDEIRFNTSCVGKPHIVKFSFFPNWKVEGAERIFSASSGFMVVFPMESKVRLYYETHFSDILGIVMSVFGLVILFLRFWYERGVKDVLE